MTRLLVVAALLAYRSQYGAQPTGTGLFVPGLKRHVLVRPSRWFPKSPLPRQSANRCASPSPSQQAFSSVAYCAGMRSAAIRTIPR